MKKLKFHYSIKKGLSVGIILFFIDIGKLWIDSRQFSAKNQYVLVFSSQYRVYTLARAASKSLCSSSTLTSISCTFAPSFFILTASHIHATESVISHEMGYIKNRNQYSGYSGNTTNIHKIRYTHTPTSTMSIDVIE